MHRIHVGMRWWRRKKDTLHHYCISTKKTNSNYVLHTMGKKHIYHGPNHTLNIKMEEVTYRVKNRGEQTIIEWLLLMRCEGHHLCSLMRVCFFTFLTYASKVGVLCCHILENGKSENTRWNVKRKYQDQIDTFRFLIFSSRLCSFENSKKT